MHCWPFFIKIIRALDLFYKNYKGSWSFFIKIIRALDLFFIENIGQHQYFYSRLFILGFLDALKCIFVSINFA